VGEAAKWIKVATDTFEDEKIDVIEGMPDGEKFVLIWFKIILLAGRSNSGGYLLLQEDIPFTPKMLARRFKQELSVVNKALKTFEKYKMIERTEEGIYVTNFNKHQDLDKMNQKRVQDRERKQKQRAKEKVLSGASENEAVEEENMSSDMSQKNECDKQRDSSYSSSTSISKSSNIISLGDIKNNKSYIDFFNNNFHKITDYEREILVNYEYKGMNEKVITLALKEAVEENARSLKYVRKILDRWLNSKVLTVEEVVLDKAEFGESKKGANSTHIKAKDKIDNFNNFEQRSYDFDYLEKRLLGWDIAQEG
jgi:predicted phage replisome organizer